MSDQVAIVDNVGIDTGFKQAKCVFDLSSGETGTLIYPSIAGRPDRNALEVIEGRGPDGFTLEVGGAEFFVGRDSALFSHVRGSLGFRPDYSETLEYKALQLAGLCYVAKAHNARRLTIRSLCVGLPLHTFSTHQANLQAMCQGQHDIAVRGGSGPIQVTVETVKVIAQPQGALFSQALYGKPILANQTSLVIDVGGGTTDWFLASGYRPIPGRCGCHPVGTLECAEAVAEALGRGLGKKKQVLARVDAALALGSGSVLIDGEERALPLQVATHRMKEIFAEVLDGVRDLSDVDRVILTGGGARLLEPVLRQHMPRRDLAIDPDPIFSNARGFHRVAAMMRNREKEKILARQ